MQNHTKVYYKHHNLVEGEFVHCEVCGMLAVDIHHLDKRGMGGSKVKDVPENLMALCRSHHDLAENSKIANEKMTTIHATFMLINPYKNPDIDWDKIWQRNLYVLQQS